MATKKVLSDKKKQKRNKITASTIRKSNTSARRTEASKARDKKTTKVVMTEEKTRGTKRKNYFDNLRRYEKPFVGLVILIGVAALLFMFVKWAVIAWVDKLPVTRFQLYSELDKRYGSQTKEQLITQQLVLNEAKNKNVTVSNDEINQEYKKVQDQVGGVEMLNNLLKQQNISESDFRNQLKLQLMVTKMFGQGINVTDDEVKKFAAENQPGASASPLTDQQKQQAKTQLTQQKISQNFQTWLQQAQGSNRIMRF